MSTEARLRQYASAHAEAVALTAWGDVSALAAELEDLRRRDGLLLMAGNGGSAATASHFAIDFSKGASLEGRPALRAIALADCSPVVTAIGNDLSFDDVFAFPLARLARRGDALLVVSASGRSPNILNALTMAGELGLRRLALLGMGGGPAADLADVAVTVPSDDYGVIEDVHMMIGHALTALLRSHGGGYDVA